MRSIADTMTHSATADPRSALNRAVQPRRLELAEITDSSDRVLEDVHEEITGDGPEENHNSCRHYRDQYPPGNIPAFGEGSGSEYAQDLHVRSFRLRRQKLVRSTKTAG